jgi:hypothetical protein
MNPRRVCFTVIGPLLRQNLAEALQSQADGLQRRLDELRRISTPYINREHERPGGLYRKMRGIIAQLRAWVVVVKHGEGRRSS